MPTDKTVLGDFNNPPRKDSFAARVARAKNADANTDVSQLSEDERASLMKATALEKAAKDFKFVPPTQALERVEIIFDNSGSMAGDKIKDAKSGVTEFMKACVPNESAVRITPLNSDEFGSHRASVVKFTCNLPSVAKEVDNYSSGGGTPLYARIKAALTRSNGESQTSSSDLKPSRMIAFSDGEAGDGFARLTRFESYMSGDTEMESESHREIVKLAKDAGIIIDTCYISESGGGGWRSYDSAEQTMKRIAEDTGGVFIKFEKGKCDFSRGFKYLTKGNRLLLTDQAFKSKLEAGQI